MAANTSLTCSAIKTTVLREVARMQSDLYRLKAVVVNTWSELGGVGRARVCRGGIRPERH